MRMIDLIDEFVYDCEIRKLTESTVKGYRNHLRVFDRYLQEIGITQIHQLSRSYA